ncbi:MAG: helicase-related protein [Myxococcota bacterium]
MSSSPPPNVTLPTRGGGSRITALLGPTNTGKTHRAIEQLIAYGSGMIGLPLRLLAREVYDRIRARVGDHEVALLTGEERIVPPLAKYWVCTVESMPVHKMVPFVVIDEVQLATHPTRGHVFTDRLMNARGTRETWFLGSDTMRPLLERLTPTVEFQTFERLSALSYIDPRPMEALPKRSAVIAFSTRQVYALADQLRALHGGVAVVLGALSPRARNAQVELFESGQVPYLVATDAIGMGLNLDIRYVFFAALRKFDGQEHRDLEPWELGQIAGRAGRYRSNGSFGLIRDGADVMRLPGWVIEAVERQRFAAVSQVWYRNSNLDFTSLESLREGLLRAPFAGYLLHARGADDQQALEAMLKMPDIAASLHTSERVERLWECCQIPDYQQRSSNAHARLVALVYRQVLDRQRIDNDWLDEQLGRLEILDGDLEQMMRRIAQTRTFAYIAHRSDWVYDPEHWRARIGLLEERLSEALHRNLTQHFVDERAAVQVARPKPHDVCLDGDEVQTRTVPLGWLEGFSFVPGLEAQRLFGVRETRRQGRQVCLEAAATRAAALLEAGPEALRWGDDLRIWWTSIPLASLNRGTRVDAPRVVFPGMDLLAEEDRRSIRALVEGWVRARIEAFHEGLPRLEQASPVNGVLYVLRSRLGVVPRSEVIEQVEALSGKERKQVARRDVRLGVDFVYATFALKPMWWKLRAACWAAWLELESPPAPPIKQVAPTTVWSDAFALGMGYPRLGARCVRVDMLERVTASLRQTIRRGPAELPTEPMRWLGCSREDWEALLTALGYRLRREGVYPPRRRPPSPKRRRRGGGSQ